MRNNLILRLKNLIHRESIIVNAATDIDILNFEKQYGVVLPEDLKEYFKTVNGSAENYDEFFFSFQSIKGFKNIDEELKYHDGVPNYSDITNILPDYRYCFVLCDYEFHLMTYAIKLYSDLSDQNQVYVISGDSYKVVANTFSEFLALYFNRSDELFI